VICLCKTWLNENILNNEILPSNDKVHQCDCGDGYDWVLIGITSNISLDLIDTPSNLEIYFISLKLSNNFAICAYRPPSGDVAYQTNLCNYIVDMVDKHPNEIICCYGDFNLPDIDWKNGSVTSHRYLLEINELAINM